jgi:hypothetical protein
MTTNQNGLITMVPTSIVATGTGNSASINTDGSVSFSSCQTLAINGVFTSDYDNYMLVLLVKGESTGGSQTFYGRLRASGVNATSGYVRQLTEANGSSITSLGFSDVIFPLGGIGSTSAGLYSGSTHYFWGPYAAQQTAILGLETRPDNSAYWGQQATRHGLTTRYDGFILDTNSSSNKAFGILTVFGFNQ